MENKKKSYLIFIAFWVLALYFGGWKGQNAFDSETGKNALFLVLFNLGFSFILFLEIKRKRINFFFLKELMFFLFIILITSLFRDNLYDSIRNFTAITLTYSIIILLTYLFHSTPFSLLIRTVIFTFLSLLPFIIYIHITYVGPLQISVDRLENNNFRLGGIFYYAHTAMIIALTILLCYLSFKQFKKHIYLVAIIPLIYLLITTGTRSTWFAVGFCFIYILFFQYIKSKAKRIFFITTAFIVSFFVFSTVAINTNTTEITDLLFRSEIWHIGYKCIIENPFIGYGPENVLSTRYESKQLTATLNDPHSSFLSLGLQSGVFSIIAFLILYGKIWIVFRKKALHSFKFYESLFYFWLIAPFFWSYIYSGTPRFISIIFPLTIFGIICHPQILTQRQFIRKNK